MSALVRDQGRSYDQTGRSGLARERYITRARWFATKVAPTIKQVGAGLPAKGISPGHSGSRPRSLLQLNKRLDT